MADLNQPVVIDSGSGLVKAGFAGSETPSLIFPAYVGRPKHKRVMAADGAADKDLFIGETAAERRGILRLSYPQEHGIVKDWSDMQRIWAHAYEKLNAVQEEHPVLLTEPPLNPTSNRAKTAEVFFESFNVPAFYSQVQSVLSLYASGRTTGVVLDCGDGVTHAVPVYEGFAMPHAIERIDVGGRDVTEYLCVLLRKAGYTFHTSSEKEVVKNIKETRCYVAFNISQVERGGAEDIEAEAEYKLPDNNVIEIGPERFRAPELLFNPSLVGLEYVGVHQCLANAIQKSDLDIRRRLYSEVVLAGGSTLFAGFGDRLLSETKKLAPRNTKIRIFAPQERILSTWIGGSILASLASFQKMWLTKREWEESGKSAIYRKTF